jgi:hypothetical protein
MPFKSLQQRKKFYALKSQGKMDQKTIDEWEEETPKNLPEKVASKKHFRRAVKSFLDSSDELVQKDPGYKKLKRKLRHKFMKKAFWDGFDKKAGAIGKAVEYLGHHPNAGHAMELGGLGILAAPDAAALLGHPFKQKNVHKTEIAGLGALAIPSAAHFASKLLTKGKA